MIAVVRIPQGSDCVFLRIFGVTQGVLQLIEYVLLGQRLRIKKPPREVAISFRVRHGSSWTDWSSPARSSLDIRFA